MNCSSHAAPPTPNSHCYDVVVLGAGIAGLAAAKTLVEAGIKNILVLEAQGHAGGRINTLPFNEGWVDAGAQWIHGENNPVWRLADKHHLLDVHISSEGEGPYLREDGEQLDPAMVQEVEQVIDEILQDCDRFCAHDFPVAEVPHSMGEHLRRKFDEYLESRDDTVEQRRMREELFDWHIRFQVIDNSSNNMDELSAKAWGEYSFSGGKDYVNLKNGYSSLIKTMTDQLPDGVLRLNSPVHEIRWPRDGKGGRPDERCLVEYDDGLSTASRHCIVTCSLGYLKEHHNTMFTPSLPPSITQAIQDIGFATINKIFLDFGQPWWDAEVDGFQLIWSRHSSDPDVWTRDLTGFDVLSKHPGVLLGWIGGRGAELVEDVAEEVVGSVCTRILRQFTRRSDIPEPRRVMRTQWRRNRYIRGAYGNTTVQCDASNSRPATLAQPVLGGSDGKVPVILLAGEATHEEFFSTTHGAFESGERQARVVIKHRDSQAKLKAKF